MAKSAAARGGSGRSLRTTFLLVALVPVILFLALIGYFGFTQMGREKGLAQESALTQARALATQIETELTARLDALTGTAEAVAGGTPADAAIRRFRQSYADVGQVLALDQLGAVVAASGPVGDARRLGDQPWFKKAATSTQPFFGEPRQAGQDVAVGVYAPARTADGQLRGVLAADLTLKRLQTVLGRTGLPSGAVAEVLTERGLVVARHPALFLMQDASGRSGYAEFLKPQEGTGELVFVDEERRLAGSAPVRSVGWVVVVGVPTAQVLAETRRALAQVVGGAALVTLLALALAVTLSRGAAAGMERLGAAMRRLEGGDIPASVPVTVGGEVGALTEGFNRVVNWLRNKLREYEALSHVEEAVGQAVASTGTATDRSASEALPGLLRRVVSGMGADAGAIVIQEEDNLVTRAGVGFAGVQAEGVTLRRGQGLAGAVVGTREPVVIEDVEGDYRVEEPYIKAAGIQSIVALPILAGDRVIGAIEVGYRSRHTFGEGELRQLEAMARRAAQAIEHARALEEVRRGTVGLEAKLAEQMAALQKAHAGQEEAKRQAEQARRQTAELQATIKMQVAQTKEVVKEVVKADPAAEETKRVRAAMQKTVSEELRVPLTALLDLPRFLVDGINKPLGEQERQQLEILHGRGEEILELIDNLVILSGVHAGQVKMQKAPSSVSELVQRVVRSLQQRAAGKGNRIQTDIKPDVGQVNSDARRVEQVLQNLITTSIKYTEVGEIRVTSYLREGNVVLTVADDGAGFSPEEQQRIFEPFLQVGPRSGRAFPGTGLSLTVCQRLVQVLGGKIKVESEVDRGTWFTVSLPVQ